MPEHPASSASVNVRLQFQEFRIPPVHDALVLGKKSPIGSEAVRRSLTLLHVAPFQHIELSGAHEDDVVGDILVRNSVLNKIPPDNLIRLVVDRVKPFMTAEEILHLRLDAEVSLEHQIYDYGADNSGG
jgi:hypothetical protein